jgi:aarF domain-containing kinase
MISLPAHFRYEYCDLWGALFLGDLPRIVEICRLWGLGAGSEELIGSAVLLRRPGSAVGRRGNTVKQAAEEKKREETAEEQKVRELEAQRAMKEKLKAFLENYELIPKV